MGAHTALKGPPEGGQRPGRSPACCELLRRRLSRPDCPPQPASQPPSQPARSEQRLRHSACVHKGCPEAPPPLAGPWAYIHLPHLPHNHQSSMPGGTLGSTMRHRRAAAAARRRRPSWRRLGRSTAVTRSCLSRCHLHPVLAARAVAAGGGRGSPGQPLAAEAKGAAELAATTPLGRACLFCPFRRRRIRRTVAAAAAD
jgi:hypothetical protein